MGTDSLVKRYPAPLSVVRLWCESEGVGVAPDTIYRQPPSSTRFGRPVFWFMAAFVLLLPRLVVYARLGLFKVSD